MIKPKWKQSKDERFLFEINIRGIDYIILKEDYDKGNWIPKFKRAFY